MKKRSFHLSLILIWTVLFFCGVAAAQQNNVIVPNVEGISQGIAAQILRTAGLQPQVQQSANSGTLVIRQDPRPGSLLPMGSEVLLVTDVRTPVTQAVSESRSVATTQTMSVSRSVPIQTSSTGTSPAPLSQITTGTNVSVTPLTTTQQATQAGQYAVTQDSMNFIIARQPQQAPANQYLLVETTAKRYPVWYPRAYLQNQGQAAALTTSQMPTTTLTPQVQPLVQSSVSPYLVQVQSVAQQRSPEWYTVPQGWSTSQAWTTQQTAPTQYQYVQVTPQMSQQGYSATQQTRQTQYVWTTQQTWPTQQGYSTTYSVQPLYGQYQVMVSGAVPVPNVMRLRQADAIFAIQKAGLVIGNILLMQNAQAGAGLVINQSPRPRSIVQSGTRVDLWVAN